MRENVYWTAEDIKVLIQLKKENCSVKAIAQKIGKSIQSIDMKWHRIKENLNAAIPPREVLNLKQLFDETSEKTSNAPMKAPDMYGVPERKIRGLEEIAQIKEWYQEKLDGLRKKCNFKSDFKYTLSETHPFMVAKIDKPELKKIKLIPIGDLHYGAAQCSVEKLQKWIDWIKVTPNVYVVLMGDSVENATRYSVGAGVYDQIVRPYQQKLWVMELLAPIRHKILASMEGNHGFRSVKEVDASPERDIASFLEIPYFQYQCYLDIVFNGKLFEIHAVHGSSGATTEGAKVNAIMKPGHFTRADIYLHGHTHDKFAKAVDEVIRDRRDMQLKRHKCYYVNTGSFMDYWGSYAEGKLYGPVPIGTVSVELYSDGDYHCSS